jgi:pimeloyl-ACP methyl ester carboxylesterase
MTTSTSSMATNSQAQNTRPRRGRRILRRIGLGILGIIGVMIACAVFGMVYEAIMSAGDAQRYPAPGQLVDVGGYQLELNCIGEGSPTVILTYGFADNLLTWNAVQKQIAAQGRVRVCAWDRAGLGWSEALPQQSARTPSDVAAELHTLLAKADIPGPYVMVGHSLGGMYTRMYAIKYPEDVVGIALLDSSHESANSDRPPKSAAELAETPSANPLYATLVRLSILRVFGQSLLTGLQPAAVYLSDDVKPTYLGLTGRLKALQAWANEEAGMTQDDPILEANTSLGDKPLALLVSTQGIKSNDRWQKAQEMMATYSSNSRLQIVPDSEHMLQWQYPEAVTATVVDVIESVRTGQPLASQ